MKLLGSRVLLALSLPLCAASVLLWIRSYWRVDSVMLFRIDRQYSTLWIDHHSTVKIRVGRVYEADSRRGGLRLLFLQNDGSYLRANYPAVWPSADEGAIEPWTATHWTGFAIESRPVSALVYNEPALIAGGPTRPPPPIAYIVHAIYMPWALWAFLTALAPLTVFWRYRRDLRRSRLGLCGSCGYDLTGNVSGVCPECGETLVSERTA